jgi:hypothetical protein
MCQFIVYSPTARFALPGGAWQHQSVCVFILNFSFRFLLSDYGVHYFMQVNIIIGPVKTQILQYKNIILPVLYGREICF